MHEFAIAQSLIETASAEAQRVGAQRVTALYCRIGVLRQVAGELLAEAFYIVRDGTLCETAELDIEKTYMQATCGQCGQAYPIHDWQWDCPVCGAETPSVTGGDELELVSIEAEVADEDSCAQEHLSAQR